MPEDYWASFEHQVDSLAAFLDAVQKISAYQAVTGTRFVWRGAADARWPLYSSLVRAYINTHGHVPMESELRVVEAEVLDEARRWGLDWHTAGGRLSSLELLAALQHFAVPTRMLDFTFNPVIALWFAVEDHPDVDGRVFAIDISDRLVAREDAALFEPWWSRIPPGVGTDWATQSWIWRPPPLEARMVRQEGCFLMGGIPSTQPGRAVRVPGGWRYLQAHEVRTCMSVPFRLIGYQQAEAAFVGGQVQGAQPTKTRAFTVRVANKVAVRAELEQAFDYSHRSLFPDFSGFARYGSVLQ